MQYIIGFVVLAWFIGSGAWVPFAWIVGGIVLVSLAFWMANAPERSRAREAQIEAHRVRKEYEEGAFNELVSRHIKELSVRKKQLVAKGPYGIVNESKWDAEVRHFIDSVYLPEIGNSSQFQIDELYKEVKERVADYERGIGPSSYDEELSPTDYEQYCADVLADCGWEARTTVATGDQGADVVAELSGVKVVIQCKKYSGSVGNKAVQEIHAAKGHYDADEAVVVSNAQYTNSARTLANSLGVYLLHHDDLERLDEILEID